MTILLLFSSAEYQIWASIHIYLLNNFFLRLQKYKIHRPESQEDNGSILLLEVLEDFQV